LRIEPTNSCSREGKILNLIAKKAFESKDYNFCSSIIKQMIKNNYNLSWSVALDLAYCDDYDDLQFRYNCMWFAINNGPSETIENLIKHANLLQVQILNAELQKYMPIQKENSDDEDTNSNGHLNDEFSRVRCINLLL
jgi:hypothetical protein